MRIVPTTWAAPFLARVIGSTDYKGSGTNHQISDINPFVLLDEAAIITNRNVPKFGLHPHSGVMVLTICLSGSVENVYIDRNGKEVKSVHGPGPFLLAVNSGRGVVHDEHTFSEDPCKLLQLAWMTGDDESDAEICHVAEPLILNEGDGTDIMLCAGTFRQKESGIVCSQNPSITVIFVTLPPGGAFQTDEFCGGNAFVYNMNYENQRGPLSVNNAQVPASHVVDMEQHSGQLKITNEGTNVVSVLIGHREPINPKWNKLLMFNGFIFAKSEEDAEKKQDEFRQVGITGFGQRRYS
jgi:redox-sensitive bicupin YhaK (pirin superfamily)